MSQDKQQANRYDKIFRENMEAVLAGIVKHLLNWILLRYRLTSFRKSVPI
ncbi:MULTISPECIES: hypothetical protein [Olivibacter]|uniref:Uncharacterized protein n=1 Tax=Olivibacter jilunii TaxID=985016 RepID=A0ABW6BCH7_9SPHI